MKQCCQVIAREEILVLPAYREPESEELPMFAENRVHQRSSGNPYPNRIVAKVDRGSKENKTYKCIRLENEYLCIQILPELGGRVYSALDKTTGYDFFYRQHVIKPALIGMLGSWISGGLEFNWPCHHRPSTFMPVDYFIERDSDGSATVWMSEHEPLNRMKGMVGVHLAPGEAIFETRMKVYNRTPVRRSFLWWENAAVPVNKNYRLFFPPDVRYVQFHYRKNVTSFPLAKGTYNGIRMGDGKDIRFHRNTMQPTSYFCASTRYDFFGGYDEDKQCGVVHVADRNTSVGKKMFTWAYNKLAQSWETALTDTDGMYAELMASSYSLNQPDFAWLEAYEEKVFTQCWYPIGAVGEPVCATRYAVVSVDGHKATIQVTSTYNKAYIVVNDERTQTDLIPGKPFIISNSSEIKKIVLEDVNGRVLLAYDPAGDKPETEPDPLPDVPTLDLLHTAHECYIAGVHVAQYRDPAVLPDAYWLEALKHEAGHAPSLHALARYRYEHAFFEEALAFGLKAWHAYTAWNFHPESGDIAYTLGLIHEGLGRSREAYDWYQKAAWNQDARSRAMTRIAALDGKNRDYPAMLAHAEEALMVNTGNHLASALAAVGEHHLGHVDAALQRLTLLLKQDPVDLLARTLLHTYGGRTEDVVFLTDAYQNALDISDDLVDMGEADLARNTFSHVKRPSVTAFPFRHSEIAMLRESSSDNYGLACALYSHRHFPEAVALWESAAAKEPEDYRTLRNLAVAYYSHLGRENEALPLLERALALHPGDEQLIWETSYLMGRRNVLPKPRIAFLAKHCGAEPREDILIEWARALNQDGQYGKALQLLKSHRFTPCEGGEHAVAEQYMFALHAMGRELLNRGDTTGALDNFRQAQVLPDSLGAGLWHEALLVPHRFYEAECLDILGKNDEARLIRKDICALAVDYFSNMHLPELRCWQAKSYELLGQNAKSQKLLRLHLRQVCELGKRRYAGYFKTTPFFLSYVEPADKLREAACNWQMAVAAWAAGDPEKASSYAGKSLEGEPFQLYARLLIRNA